MNTQDLRRTLALPPADALSLPPTTDLVRAGRRRRAAHRLGVVGSGASVAAALLAVPFLAAQAGQDGGTRVAAAGPSSSATGTATSTPPVTTDPLTRCTPYRPAGSTPLPGSGEIGWPAPQAAAVAIGTTPDGARVCAWIDPPVKGVPANVAVAPDAAGWPHAVAAGVVDTARPAWWWTNLPAARNGTDWYVVGVVPATARTVTLTLVDKRAVDVTPVRLNGADAAGFYASPQTLRLTWQPTDGQYSPVTSLTWTDAAGTAHVVAADAGSTVG